MSIGNSLSNDFQRHVPPCDPVAIKQQNEIATLLEQQQKEIDQARQELRAIEKMLIRRAEKVGRLQQQLSAEQSELKFQHAELAAQKKAWREHMLREEAKLAALRTELSQQQAELSERWERVQRAEQALEVGRGSTAELAQQFSERLLELERERAKEAEANAVERQGLAFERAELERERLQWRENHATAQTRWAKYQQDQQHQLDERKKELQRWEHRLSRAQAAFEVQRRRHELAFKMQRSRLQSLQDQLQRELLVVTQQRSKPPELDQQRRQLELELHWRRRELQAIVEKTESVKRTSQGTNKSSTQLAHLAVVAEILPTSQTEASDAPPPALQRIVRQIELAVEQLERMYAEVEAIAEDLETQADRLEEESRQLQFQRELVAERNHRSQPRHMESHLLPVRLPMIDEQQQAASRAQLEFQRRKFEQEQQLAHQDLQTQRKLFDLERQQIEAIFEKQRNSLCLQKAQLDERQRCLETQKIFLNKTRFSIDKQLCDLANELVLLFLQTQSLLEVRRELERDPKNRELVQRRLTAVEMAGSQAQRALMNKVDQLYERLLQSIEEMQSQQLQQSVPNEPNAADVIAQLREELEQHQKDIALIRERHQLQSRQWLAEKEALQQMVTHLEQTIENLAGMYLEEQAPPMLGEVA